MDKVKRVEKFLKNLSSLVCTVSGAGLGYMIAQSGSLAYIAAREITNIATGNPVASLTEILRDYAVYTSAAALIGEVGGYIFHKKIWKVFGR